MKAVTIEEAKAMDHIGRPKVHKNPITNLVTVTVMNLSVDDFGNTSPVHSEYLLKEDPKNLVKKIRIFENVKGSDPEVLGVCVYENDTTGENTFTLLKDGKKIKMAPDKISNVKADILCLMGIWREQKMIIVEEGN